MFVGWFQQACANNVSMWKLLNAQLPNKLLEEILTTKFPNGRYLKRKRLCVWMQSLVMLCFYSKYSTAKLHETNKKNCSHRVSSVSNFGFFEQSFQYHLLYFAIKCTCNLESRFIRQTKNKVK